MLHFKGFECMSVILLSSGRIQIQILQALSQAKGCSISNNKDSTVTSSTLLVEIHKMKFNAWPVTLQNTGYLLLYTWTAWWIQRIAHAQNPLSSLPQTCWSLASGLEVREGFEWWNSVWESCRHLGILHVPCRCLWKMNWLAFMISADSHSSDSMIRFSETSRFSTLIQQSWLYLAGFNINKLLLSVMWLCSDGHM